MIKKTVYVYGYQASWQGMTEAVYTAADKQGGNIMLCVNSHGQDGIRYKKVVVMLEDYKSFKQDIKAAGYNCRLY